MTRTLEDRLKFGQGFTINHEHPVTLTKNGMARLALVFIPTRGAPRLIVKTGTTEPHYKLTVYLVKGNDLEYRGSVGTPYSVEQFDTLTQNPVATIEF